MILLTPKRCCVKGLGGLLLQAKLTEPRPGAQRRRTGLPDEINEVLLSII